MNPPDTAIVTTPSYSQSEPESEVLQVARTHVRLAADEWRPVRTGLGLMAWSLAVFLLGALGTAWRSLVPGPSPADPATVLLGFLCVSVFLVGLRCSMMPPPRARLGGWITASVLPLAAWVVLFAAVLIGFAIIPGMGLGMNGELAAFVVLSGMALAGVGAPLGSHLAYCLYLAAIARLVGARRLARWLIACFIGFLVQGILIILAVVALASLEQRGWAPRARWTAFSLGAGGMILSLGVAWVVLLWRLRKCLPREQLEFND
jgi:hypothetical protein